MSASYAGVSSAARTTRAPSFGSSPSSVSSGAASGVSRMGSSQAKMMPRTASGLSADPCSSATSSAGAPAELVALLQGSALKPEAVRCIIFAWLDPILETPDAAPLETLLGQLPKDGARVVLAAELTPAYEALIERYARRARRAVETPADEQ